MGDKYLASNRMDKNILSKNDPLNSQRRSCFKKTLFKRDVMKVGINNCMNN